MSGRRRRGGAKLFANWPGAEPADGADGADGPPGAEATAVVESVQAAHTVGAGLRSVVRGPARLGRWIFRGLCVPYDWTLQRWPGRNYIEDDEDEDFEELLEPVPTPARPVLPVGGADEDRPVRRRRRVPLLGLRQLARVASAVYTALADPLVGGGQEARERRLARLRSAALVAGTTVLAAVVIYAMFPVRAYLDQRAATSRAEDRLKVIGEQNERLSEYVEELQDEDVIERIAREDYGLILPGEESYPLLPAPED